MSTKTETTETEVDEGGRSFRERLKASPFLSQLFSNRLALVGMAIIGVIFLIAIAMRIIYSKYFMPELTLESLKLVKYGTNEPYVPPGWEHFFGTDKLARDMFSRVLYGSWLAVKFGTVTVGASTLLGVTLGIVAAYYGGWRDNLIMRTMDILLAFPSLLLALAIVAILGQGLWKAVLALTLVYTPRFARVVRGAALKVMEDDYIDASLSLGAGDLRILVRHVLPNCIAPITVQSTLNYGLAIIDLAALSFLGFGAEPGTPSWGIMLSEGTNVLFKAWWWSFFPGLFLAITVLGFNLLGDGMRDALDPRMREAVD